MITTLAKEGMMKKYDRTQQQILEAGKKHFLKYGFEKANLREICKDIYLTTGAFYRHFESKEELFKAIVQPVLDKLFYGFTLEQEAFFNALQTGPLAENFSRAANHATQSFVDFIYEYFDVFELLLFKAQGTPYSDFYEDMVNYEDKNIKRSIESLKEKGYDISYLTDNEIHMLNSALYATFFEIVNNKYTLEEAKHYMETMMVFYTSGWEALLRRK